MIYLQIFFISIIENMYLHKMLYFSFSHYLNNLINERVKLQKVPIQSDKNEFGFQEDSANK